MVTPENTPLNLDDQQMLIVFNHVRPDKREDYMSFVNDVLCPAAASLRPVSICHTTMLEPHVMNEDGSFTYVLLLDPAFLDIEEPVQTILTKVYGEDGSKTHLETYLSCQAQSRADYVLSEKDED